MATKNKPGAYDCYQNAEPDEPMFVLLGRDRHAAALVAFWAALRRRDGEDQAVVDEAVDCSRAMLQWALDRGKKPLDAFTAQGVLNDMVKTMMATFKP